MVGALKLASYGIRFSENVRATIDEIIQETNSETDEIATNVTGETYELIDVFSRLSKKDMKQLVNSEFSNICESKGVVSSVLDLKFKLVKNTGDPDKYQAVCVAAPKSEIANIINNHFSGIRVSSAAPLGTSIVNILPNKGIEEQVAIINIEAETVVTVIEHGEISDAKSFPIGMKDVLPKLAEKYNSYSKAYEACKGVSAYIEDVYSLEESDREILDLLIPMLYDLRSKIEAFLKSHLPMLSKIYITGTGIIINNLDIYFHEVFTDKTCQLLVPYFLPKDSNNLNDIVEVNTAIALAFNGLGYADREAEFMSGSSSSQMNSELLKRKFEEIKGSVVGIVTGKKPAASGATATLKIGNIAIPISASSVKKKKINIEFNDEIVQTEVEGQPLVDYGEESAASASGTEEKGPFFDKVEAGLARLAGGVLLTFGVYCVVANYTQEIISEKRVEINSNSAQIDQWIKNAQNDVVMIDKETNKYKDMKSSLVELLSKVTTRKVSFDIPNFMSKLMFVIPENVKVTSIVVDDGRVQMSAESGQYAQLGYFVSRLKLDNVLTDVDMSVESMQGNIKIKVSGAMP